MLEHDRLAEQFEANRTRLHSVALRVLGTTAEADDAVQEAWLRVSRADADGIDNMPAWLTTVVARICLDMLRSRKSRHEEPLEDGASAQGADPEQEAMLADSVGLALLVVLEQLTPSERVAFVLHDMFELPFDDIARVVNRTPEAARQLASRARRRVRGAQPNAEADTTRRREVVEAFLAASRAGDFARLLELLDPDAVMSADGAIQLEGANAVATQFAGRAKAAQPVLIDGEPGLVWRQRRVTRVVFRFTFAGGKIAAIDLVSDPKAIAGMELT